MPSGVSEFTDHMTKILGRMKTCCRNIELLILVFLMLRC